LKIRSAKVLIFCNKRKEKNISRTSHE